MYYRLVDAWGEPYATSYNDTDLKSVAYWIWSLWDWWWAWDDEAFYWKTDEEVVETMKSRFCNEVMPGALGMLHPDAAPIEGLDVIYTINFGVYTGSTSNYTARFKVIGQGQFEFMDCTW